MLILSLDSAATVASVALVRDETVLGEYTLNAGNTHSVTLLPMIEHLLKMTGKKIEDIDLFAISEGPGSFTGVRIGAACIKGLAFQYDKPCVGVSTLEALAYNLRGFGGIICPCMNARRDQVYTALFRDGDYPVRLTDDMAISVSELSEMLSGYENVYFCGDGYFLVSHLSDFKTPDRLCLQSGVSVAAVAKRKYDLCEDRSVFTSDSLAPTYLRKPQAEREREERLKNEN
ncbi:MAG: tRNA (adenosine(37)-N6)-threonylcarbamoyltransferase complex dimerization subunit type 1 TsaB [Ruminococcaceae bacterium]|nr:tRNA (adenosine(37)-N6)-threonylcarbamoyltransferase complex dimerization subunit type 1 TsaB [Oscillospiraceae bacterium]